jgi:hypothetical protein
MTADALIPEAFDAHLAMQFITVSRSLLTSHFTHCQCAGDMPADDRPCLPGRARAEGLAVRGAKGDLP